MEAEDHLNSQKESR